MKINQRGFGALEVVLIIVVAGVIGLTGLYLLQANSKADEKQTAATQKAVEPAAKPANVSLQIGDATVELAVPETMSDLTVARTTDTTVNSVALTWAVLATGKLKACEGSGGGVIGSIYKIDGKYATYPLGGIDETEGVYVKQAGDYYLMFQGPQSDTCGDTAYSGAAAYKLVKQAMIDSGWVHETK